jgi:Mycobacterium membrane protein
MFKLLKRVWIPIVVVVVVGVASFLVIRIRSYFGDDFDSGNSYAAADELKPFNPKIVTYNVFGVPGATADINYLDLDAQPQQVEGATLPWSLTLSTTAPGVMPNIVAQGNGHTISCRITVDDVVKDERTTDGINAQTFCLVKNA